MEKEVLKERKKFTFTRFMASLIKVVCVVFFFFLVSLSLNHEELPVFIF